MAKTKNFPTAERIRHLYVMQSKGKSKAARTRARNELEALTREMQKTANRRLKRLQSSNYAYGTVYDTTMQYLSQTGRKAFTLPADIRRGREQIGAEAYHYALRLRGFLRSKETTISGQKAIEQKRFATFRRNPTFGNLASSMSDAQLRDFLKFMGNAGVDEYLDVFGGKSGDEVEDLMYQFERADSSERARMEDLFKQYQTWADYQAEIAKYGEDAVPIPDDSMKSYSELRKDLGALYEDISKRRRN